MATFRQKWLFKLIERWGHRLPPTSKHLAILSRNDRPGLDIQLPKSQIELGRICLRAQQFDEALYHFEQAIIANQRDSWAWHGKGDSHQGKKDYNNARDAYLKATQLSPLEGLHWGGLANSHQGLRNQKECAKFKQRALELDASLTWMFTS